MSISVLHEARLSMTRHCVLHDFMLVSGGAEKLVDALATGLKACLVVGFSAQELREWASGRDGRLYPLGPPLLGKLARYLVTAWRFTHILPILVNREAVIYSGVIAPMAVHRQREGRRIYYCHSPPRFLYDLKDYYAAKTGWLGRVGLVMLDCWLRPRYESAVRAMDVVVANSENVRRRLERHVGVDAVVVHPPIDTGRYRWVEQGGFFLSTARLEDFKRVDLIVKAFQQMPDQRLVVASGGGEEATLRKLAAGFPNITFTSWLSGSDLADLVGRCRAVIYIPIDEDFGMSPVEAMAAGKPVIGVAEGGLLETVVEGETGILLSSPPTIDGLMAAVGRMNASSALSMRPACEVRAQQFSKDLFLRRIREIVEVEKVC